MIKQPIAYYLNNRKSFLETEDHVLELKAYIDDFISQVQLTPEFETITIIFEASNKPLFNADGSLICGIVDK